MLQRRTSAWPARLRRLFTVFPLMMIAALASPFNAAAAPSTAKGTGTYTNPLPLEIPGGGLVESCADPTVIEGQEPGDDNWYMYCTTDPLNDEDLNAESGLNFHLIPMFQSEDLVNWTYMGDAFSTRPSWAAPNAGIWAPEVDYIDGTYYMFFGVTDVADSVSGEPGCNGDNAIGYATSDDPVSGWTYQGMVVEPRRAGGGCNFFWTYDPEVIQDTEGNWWIYYGSYFGGIWVRPLEITEAGEVLPTDPGEQVQVTIANRYEGPEVVYKDGFYYLFVSATNCCVGERTGYSVFVGRSTSPTGPFVDREGVSLLAGRVGGTPFLSMNGNEWVGPGHNTVFMDEEGQWWTMYHAINRFDPYFEVRPDINKRPALLDPVDWINGWPTVRGGLWASDTPQHAPAAQEGQKSNYKTRTPAPDQLGKLIFAEEFSGSMSSEWSWVREPAATVDADGLVFPTQNKDLYEGNNSASVLLLPAFDGNYVVETKVRLDLPAEGCCFNYTQAGLVIYGDDDNYLKLTHVSIWETRQTEWAKEAAGRYGNTVVGPPSDWTYLRIVKRQHGGEERYTAYTSTDGVNWVRGGTWTHNLGEDAQIGLVSMGGSGFTAEFDYVRMYHLNSGQGGGGGKKTAR